MIKIKTLGTALIAATIALALAPAAMAMSANMKIIGKANPPIGHYEFCKVNPTECNTTTPDRGPGILTQERWKVLLDVNYTINTKIQPMTDMEIYGVEERWAYPTTVGDCEDYALLKQRTLVQQGFSPADLLITVVLQPNGEGHAVLTVRTDHGDFILDNMRNKVLLWSETEYTFLKRQQSGDPARWVKLQDGRSTIAVGSTQ
jgi:predicted transglutaminase-like cysteine proteinase